MDSLEIATATINAVISLQSQHNNETLFEHLKNLRNLCAKGESVQNVIASNETFQACLKQHLYISIDDTEINRLKSMAWQLLANTIVNNSNTQRIIWNLHGNSILENCIKPPLGKHTDIQLMIIYNVFKSNQNNNLLSDKATLQVIVQLWSRIIAEKYQQNLEYLHFLYELFIVEFGRRTVNSLMQMQSEERAVFLDYLASYIRHDSPNGLVHNFLLQHISKEFKMKSDCVLRQITQSTVDSSHPREVFALLRVIASASGSEKYEHLYTQDHALFLNVTSLLRCLVAAGKEEKSNIFTPMSKLVEVAPSSTQVSRDFETEVSYEIKTLLVRSIANLLYKNPTNQGYCLDTDLMPALFECTNMDARNPLMKEWSILAIRNACIGCPQIQEIVANLTQKGFAKNDIMNELNLEMGSLRIQPNKE